MEEPAMKDDESFIIIGMNNEGKLTLHEGTRASIPDKTGLVHHDHGMVGDHKRHPSKIPEKLYTLYTFSENTFPFSLYMYYTYNNRYF